MGTSGLLPTEDEWPAGEVYVPTCHRASREARHMVLPTNGRGKRAPDAVPAAVHTGDTVNRKRDGRLVAQRGRERRRRRRMRKRRSASERPARSPSAVIDNPPRRVPNGPGGCAENDARVWQHDPKNLPCPHEKSIQPEGHKQGSQSSECGRGAKADVACRLIRHPDSLRAASLFGEQTVNCKARRARRPNDNRLRSWCVLGRAHSIPISLLIPGGGTHQGQAMVSQTHGDSAAGALLRAAPMAQPEWTRLLLILARPLADPCLRAHMGGSSPCSAAVGRTQCSESWYSAGPALTETRNPARGDAVRVGRVGKRVRGGAIT
ncbi:hypothetical protein BD413DRAFT_596935 [Trametes elegans]|nr:hypothetical protein BD413DRAFT_596935 [Trametes elegans]